MIRPTLCLFFSRRHFARSSKIFRAAESSIKMGALESLSIPPLVELFHFMFFKLSPRDLLEPNFTFGAEYTLNQLGAAHLQAEECHGRRFGWVHGRTAGQVKREGRFTHGRPCRQDDQVGGLPAVCDLIQRRKPVGTPVISSSRLRISSMR